MSRRRCRYCGATDSLVELRGQGSWVRVTITVCQRCASRARARVQRLITPTRRTQRRSG